MKNGIILGIGIILIVILVLSSSFILALEPQPVVKEPTQWNIWLTQLKKILLGETYSIVGVNRVCGVQPGGTPQKSTKSLTAKLYSSPYTPLTITQKGVAKDYYWEMPTGYTLDIDQIDTNSICSSGHALYNWFINWVPQTETKDSIYIYCPPQYASASACQVQVYCCPEKECTSDSECGTDGDCISVSCVPSGKGYGYWCPGENEIMYMSSSYSYCKQAVTKDCFYRDEGTQCLSYPYANIADCSEVGTFAGRPLFNSKPECEAQLGIKCSQDTECLSTQVCDNGNCVLSPTPTPIPTPTLTPTPTPTPPVGDKCTGESRNCRFLPILDIGLGGQACYENELDIGKLDCGISQTCCEFKETLTCSGNEGICRSSQCADNERNIGKLDCGTSNCCVKNEGEDINGTTIIKAQQPSLPWDEWKEASPTMRIKTTCSVDENCQPYDDLSGSGKNYTVECKQTSEIVTQLDEDYKAVCDTSWIKQLGRGTTWLSGLGCITGIGLTVGCAFFTGGLCTVAAPTILITACTTTAVVGTATLTGCAIFSQPDFSKGACIAIPKAGEGAFCWQQANTWLSPITGTDNCSTNTIVLIVITVLAFILILRFVR